MTFIYIFHTNKHEWIKNKKFIMKMLELLRDHFTVVGGRSDAKQGGEQVVEFDVPEAAHPVLRLEGRAPSNEHALPGQ